MNFTIHHYYHCDPQVEVRLRNIEHKLDLIILNQEKAMATIDDVLAGVTEESTRLDSIQSLIDGIRQQLSDALSGASVPPAIQTKIDAVFTALTENRAKIDAALNVNVPPPVP